LSEKRLIRRRIMKAHGLLTVGDVVGVAELLATITLVVST